MYLTKMVEIQGYHIFCKIWKPGEVGEILKCSGKSPGIFCVWKIRM